MMEIINLYVWHFIFHQCYTLSHDFEIHILPNLWKLYIFDTLEILSALTASIANLILFHIGHKYLYTHQCLCRDMVHS